MFGLLVFLVFIPGMDQRWEGIYVGATDNQMKTISLQCIKM